MTPSEKSDADELPPSRWHVTTILCDYCPKVASRVMSRGLKSDRRFSCSSHRCGTRARMLQPAPAGRTRHDNVPIAQLEAIVRADYRASKNAGGQDDSACTGR